MDQTFASTQFEITRFELYISDTDIYFNIWVGGEGVKSRQGVEGLSRSQQVYGRAVVWPEGNVSTLEDKDMV
jgi:hypothetical protein